MRLSEALGLVWDDIHLDHEYPHINLKPYPWRRLKTLSSKRLIPLVGVALKAINLMHCQRSNRFLFPSYASKEGCNGNSCSATTNKWLKQFSADFVVHSFRHSFRDRLRDAEVQSELIDQLGGWSNKTVGRNYGKGYSIKLLNETLNKISK